MKWTKLADLPVLLSGTYAVADNMKVYVTGCLSPNDDSYHEVYVYDCASDQWDKLPQSGHYYGVPHVVGGKLVLIGGRLSANKERTNKVSTFDQSDQCWVRHHPDMLSARSRPGVASYSEYVIVLGGGTEVYFALDTIEILNYVVNLQWIEVPLHLPIPMWRTTPTIVDGQLYIINYNYKMPMQEAYMIPVASILGSNGSSEFTKLAPPITFAAAVFTNFPIVLVCGGINKENSTNDMLMYYDTITKSWKNIKGNLSESRSFAAATAVTSNAVIIIGGYRHCENLDYCLSTVELGQAELITIK